MKKRKLKFLKITLVALVGVFLFRGPIFRIMVSYQSVGERELIELNDPQLILEVNQSFGNQDVTIETIVETAHAITADRLKFTFENAHSNPNQLAKTGKSNCVGYAAMFTSIVSYLIVTHNLEQEFKATHHIGKLELLGMDLHQFTNSSFFSDHDYCEVLNAETHETLALDPSVFDYLRISSVSK